MTTTVVIVGSVVAGALIGVAAFYVTLSLSEDHCWGG
jgi:uncharacterized integral membrane protein